MKIENVLRERVKSMFANLSRHGAIVPDLYRILQIQAEIRASAGIVDEINPPPITRFLDDSSYRTQA